MTSVPLLLLLALQLSAPSTQVPDAPAAPTQAAAAEQLAQAEARYRTALGVTPGIAAYHESLALVLEREGRLEDALVAHTEAVRLDSTAFRNQAGLGELLLRLGRSEAAIPHLQAAARINRTSIDVRKSLAAALLNQSRRNEALVALREARQLDSSDNDIERSLRQAEATAPGMGHENDVTITEDRPIGRIIRGALEWVFGTILVLASLAMLIPLLGGAISALVHRPHRRPTEVLA